MTGNHEDSDGKRLDTWKEIGAFLGRDERTAKRWEKERGLPVHRVPGTGRATVFAYTGELTRWLHRDEGPAATTPALPNEPEPARHRRVGLITAVAIAVVGIAVVLLLVRPFSSRAAAKAHVPNPEAQDLYLKGSYFWHKRTPESLQQAVDLFTQSIVRDPAYAPAYVGLANCYNLLREYTAMPAAEAYPRAIAAAKRAIALDDSLSDAHSALAFGEFYWEWKPQAALAEYHRAIELDPHSVPAHHWLATSLMCLGRFPEALAEIETARNLDPGSNAVLADKGLILYAAGQRNEAIALLRQIEAAEPTFLSPPEYLAAIYFAQGDSSLFLAEWRRVALLRHDLHQQELNDAAAKAFATGGRPAMLAEMLAAQKKDFAAGREEAYALARTAVLAGDKQAALAYLRLSFSRHEEHIIGIEVDAAFAGLRSDPAFRELVGGLGLL